MRMRTGKDSRDDVKLFRTGKLSQEEREGWDSTAFQDRDIAAKDNKSWAEASRMDLAVNDQAIGSCTRHLYHHQRLLSRLSSSGQVCRHRRHRPVTQSGA